MNQSCMVHIAVEGLKTETKNYDKYIVKQITGN